MPGQASLIRAANAAAVVHELRSSGASSRADLARRTGLAKQTVSTIVAGLLHDGVVREVGLVAPNRAGGRPGTLVEYAADRAFVAGVQLGVGHTRVVLADALGTPVRSREVDLPGRRRAAPERVIDAVVDALVELVGDGQDLRLLRAVGVSVTGLVRPSTGTCVLAPNLGWRDVAVGGLLADRLSDRACSAPVLVRGAAQASLLAESREGAAMGAEDVVLLFEDEGVGAAVIEGGRLLEGTDGTAGELGHCAWPGAAERCGCGRRGCVETLASGPGVRRAVERAVGHRVRRPAGVPTLEALAACDQGSVSHAARHGGHVLGVAASWLVALTAPRLVLLSGSIVNAPASYRSALEAVLRVRSLDGSSGVEVRPGALGEGAALRGAVIQALEAARAAHAT